MFQELIDRIKAAMSFDQFKFSDINAKISPEYLSISSLLPYRIYDDQNCIFENANSYGFILESSLLCGCDENMINILTGMINDSVEDETSIQIMLWASPKVGANLDKWRQVRSGTIYQELAAKRYDFLSKNNALPLSVNHNVPVREFRNFIMASMPATHSGAIELLKSLRITLKSTLKSIGLETRDVNAENFVNLMREFINPDFNLHYNNDLYFNACDSLNGVISNPDNELEVSEDKLLFSNNIEVRTLSVKHLPDVWAGWRTAELLGDPVNDYLQIPCPFLISFSFSYDLGDQKNRAMRKQEWSSRQANSYLGKFIPDVKHQAKDWQFVLDKVGEGIRLVRANYQVTLFAKKGKIDECTRALISLYKSKGWQLHIDKKMQLLGFLSSMPFTMSEDVSKGLDMLNRKKSMLTWSCANIAPIYGEWYGIPTEIPCLMLLGRRGQILFWNPFDNDEGNYNLAVIGKSGSGKSVLMQELVASLRGIGGAVIVIDDGRSFMNSCILQQGHFIEFSDNKHLCLNPFSIVKTEDFKNNNEYRGEVISLLNSMIQAMCRQNESTSDYENSLIEKAVDHVFDCYGTQGSITHVSQYLAKDNDPRAIDLSVMLRSFTKDGIYGHYFEGQANIPLDNDLMVFELAEIKSKKRLQSVVLMILMFLVSEKMYHGNRKQSVSLVIDEAWDLLSGNASGKFIEGLSRRARKYRGQLISGSQSMNDYYKNEAAIAAIENTDWICFLAQKEESIDAIRKNDRLSASDSMVADLKSLRMRSGEYSEVLIKGPSGYAIGRLVLDSYAIALYSSKGEDVSMIQDLMAKGLSLGQAVAIRAHQLEKEAS